MKYTGVLFLILVLSFSGCGYTRKTILPRNMKTIYVETVRNKLKTDEVFAYQQGLEMDITNAVIRRLHQDGTVKVVEKDTADSILKIDLTKFEQEGLRFNQMESVQEYRLFIVVAMKLIDARTGDTIWEEPNFTGDTDYYVTDVSSIGRQKAALDVTETLAKNITNRIVEDW